MIDKCTIPWLVSYVFNKDLEIGVPVQPSVHALDYHVHTIKRTKFFSQASCSIGYKPGGAHALNLKVVSCSGT